MYYQTFACKDFLYLFCCCFCEVPKDDNQPEKEGKPQEDAKGRKIEMYSCHLS